MKPGAQETFKVSLYIILDMMEIIIQKVLMYVQIIVPHVVHSILKWNMGMVTLNFQISQWLQVRLPAQMDIHKNQKLGQNNNKKYNNWRQKCRHFFI